ncbi:hypothetical protein SECTIM467_181 [Brevibacillus phage SecTim467]|uniref:Uncharacterized protein n=2 Tax=Jenstvirus jenst TaxID=1982225 RepID=A0A0K2CP00_9CAUD|nr:hypothetical protein AVV11_gp015 [Brevibacillus phage Jenst]ALA07305.1 hypothetical protein JENST_176 [Brevibacillus phage Jenst]ALA07501.1 hypothetical protein SECTIM467_181 [Brevibacillus phage SecTim467]
MLQVKIELNGKTMSDIEDALEEAKKKILEGYGSGFDSNDSGSYSFQVDGEEDKPRYVIGDRVRVSSENDNKNYDSFRDKVLIVTDVASSREEHQGYDDSADGMALYSFETEDGEEVSCSLYEHELEDAE